jgi:predicted Holliday junction resolvase-like endonuclease
MGEAELRAAVVVLVALTAILAVACLRLRLRLAGAVREARKDAVRRSAAVVSGKVGENLAPYLGAFPWNPRDARFLGTPVDFLVFDGLSDEDVREVVFVEVKSGSSTLTTRERRVRDAVLARRVVWREIRVGE